MPQTTWISLGVLAIATSSPTVAHAADYALNFDLEQPADQLDTLPRLSSTAAASQSAPLQPAVADSAIEVLPPVPPGAEQLLASSALSNPNQLGDARSQFGSAPSSSSESSSSVDTIKFDIDAQSRGAQPETSAAPPAPVQPKPTQTEPSTTFSTSNRSARPYQDLGSLFEGGSESLVARAVGSAEGTRRADGGYNPAYYGHTDPGNGVWNMGSFSYQHGANSPDEADRKQLARLQNQAIELRQKASAYQIQLDLEEELNGIDLANQAPLAALGREGYIDRLVQAYQMGLLGSEAILWARVRSYIDPDTGRWSAPGLGNTLDGITHDQNRRQSEIKKAIEADPLVKQWKMQ